MVDHFFSVKCYCKITQRDSAIMMTLRRVYTTLALGYAVVHKHTSYSVHVKVF